MERIDIIDCIGRSYNICNIENGEFSYQQVLDRSLSGHYKLDIRFYNDKTKVAVLVETKKRNGTFSTKDKKQLFDYVSLEHELSEETKIIAILANTKNKDIQVWKIINGSTEELSDTKLKTFVEYEDSFKVKNINDKATVLENTAKLNRLLHDNGISEKLRSQFVGTCLLSLKEGLKYKGLSTPQIIAGIKGILSGMLENSLDRAQKLSILEQKVLEDQNVLKIETANFQIVLTFIEKNILPYINYDSNEGQDILSYFFTTFNKYVAREDKNQAFTPNHIAHFMCKVAEVNRNTRVLDPTCGSGTFLVQVMTQALKECETEAQRKLVKENQIYGIEFDENVFGLATTNMLIHGDGNSNIRPGSCFEKAKWIEDANINLVLMNPPYNASKNQVPKDFGKTWGKSTTDPSKGLYFVKYIADQIKNGKLLTLLPMSCAITLNGVILDLKKEILDENTLNAVFSFPSEMFYPGASAVACCMVFDLGKPHPKDYETFFGFYKNDGFEKRKGVGRIDVNSKWNIIENEWLDLYIHRMPLAGKSVNKIVTANDEWCAEAYMETDYSTLCTNNFVDTMREYASYLIKTEAYGDE